MNKLVIGCLVGCTGSGADLSTLPTPACLPEGFAIYDDSPERCCQGLRPINAFLVPGTPQLDGSPEGCTEAPGALPDEAICSPCGDGSCDAGKQENFCNCPEDCDPD